MRGELDRHLLAKPPANLRLRADLVVMDSSPSLALAGSVRTDLVVVPVDGRLALEDLQNAMPDLEEPGEAAGRHQSCGLWRSPYAVGA